MKPKGLRFLNNLIETKPFYLDGIDLIITFELFIYFSIALVSAKPDPVKYQVSLLKPGADTTPFCAGALVTPNWALTSAQCLKQSPDVLVQVGDKVVEVDQTLIHGVAGLSS